MSDLGTIANTTSLAQAIHALWAGTPALAAAVPADRVLTGRVPASEQMPYVRVELEPGGNTQRTNATLYQNQRVTFHIWTDDFDTGDSLVPIVEAAFSSNAFDWGTGGVTDFRQEGPAAATQVSTPEFHAWETTLNYSAQTWQQREDT